MATSKFIATGFTDVEINVNNKDRAQAHSPRIRKSDWTNKRLAITVMSIGVGMMGSPVAAEVRHSSSSTNFGWDTEQVLFQHNTDCIFGNKQGVGYSKNDGNNTSCYTINAHYIERMSEPQKKEYQKILSIWENLKSSEFPIQKISCWFSDLARTLEMEIEFPQHISVDLTRFYHSEEDDILTHFTLKENDEALYKDIMPMEELVHRMGVFFESLD